VRKRLVLVALSIASVTACGPGGSGHGGPTPSPTPTLTPYQRAYPVICQGQQGPPPTDAPAEDTRPPAERLLWRQGFCEGQRAVDRWQGLAPTAVPLVQKGNNARLALLASPPDCLIVKGSPAAPFCP
jgi:hypothetical protein